MKRLEFLHEFVPQARRIAVLADSTTISTRIQLANAARGLDVEPVPPPPTEKLNRSGELAENASA